MEGKNRSFSGLSFPYFRRGGIFHASVLKQRAAFLYPAVYNIGYSTHDRPSYNTTKRRIDKTRQEKEYFFFVGRNSQERQSWHACLTNANNNEEHTIHGTDAMSRRGGDPPQPNDSNKKMAHIIREKKSVYGPYITRVFNHIVLFFI
jgi:hypothetical protein